MATNTRQKIKVGKADVYIGAASTATPVSGITINWNSYTSLGFTIDGLTLDYSAEYFDVTADQTTVKLDRYLVAENLSVTFNIAETKLVTLEGLIASSTYTAGAAYGTNSNVLTIGDASSLTERTLGFQAKAALSDGSSGFEELVIWVPRVHSVGDISIPFMKDGVRQVAVTYEALGDMTQSAGARLITIYETTSSGSS